MAFQKIARLDDIWSGEMIGLTVEGTRVLLINLAGELHAYTDACPHQKTPLSLGSLAAPVLSCATHQWQFDARTGRGINPQSACLESLDLKVQDGDILLDVDQLTKTGKSCA